LFLDDAEDGFAFDQRVDEIIHAGWTGLWVLDQVLAADNAAAFFAFEPWGDRLSFFLGWHRGSVTRCFWVISTPSSHCHWWLI
jgi:hypothetical protein